MGQFTQTSNADWRATECEGKQRFDSAARAQDIASKSRKHQHYRATAYRCRHCGGWHIGGSVPTRATRDRLNSKKGK